MSETDIRAERLKKLKILKKAGMSGYPAQSARDTGIADFLAKFAELETAKKNVTLAGRVMSLRGQGGIVFADIFDGTGRIQIVLQKSEMMEIGSPSSFELFGQAVDAGDFIEATGISFTTKRGEKSIKVSDWKMLAKSLLPIPDEWFGLKDEELKLRQRYLDNICRNKRTSARKSPGRGGSAAPHPAPHRSRHRRLPPHLARTLAQTHA